MGIVARQSIKASIVTYVGAVIGFFNIILITPYCLPPEIVGLSRIFLDTAMLLAILGQVGLSSGMLRFFPEFKNQQNNLRFLSLIIPIFSFTVLTVVFFIFKPYFVEYFSSNSPLFNQYVTLTLPFALLLVYLGIVETFSNIEKRIVFPNIFKNIILKLLNILIIVLFYLKVIDIKSFIVAIIAIYGLTLLFNVFYYAKISSFNIFPEFSKLDKGLLKRFLKYLAFIFLMGLGSTIASKIDVFMISSSLNLAQTGIYTIAFYIISVVEIPSKSFLAMTYPVVSEHIHENNMEYLNGLYRRTSLIQLIIGGILFFLVWINIESIFEIMPNGELYIGGKYVVLFLGLNKIVDMATGINYQILSTSKYYKTLGVIFLIYTVVTIWLNYLLIPIYGISGAAIATLITTGGYNIVMVVLLRVKMKLFPFDSKTIIVLGIFLIISLVNILIPEISNPYYDIILRSSIIVIIFFGLNYLLRVSDDLNKIAESTLIYIKSRF